MPSTFDIQPERRLILTACVGSISVAEILATVRSIRADRRYRPEFNGVCDVTEGVFAFGADGSRLLAAELGKDADRSKGRWVFFANEPMSTALLLVFKAHRDPRTPVEVCSSLAGVAGHVGAVVTEAEMKALRMLARSHPPSQVTADPLDSRRRS